MGKYFTISELTKSSTAKQLGIDNTPTEEIKQHLEELIGVIDPIREEWTAITKKNNWGSPAIYVHSGYRCPKVNKAIGGSKTSEHMLGYAVDFEPVNQHNLEFYNFMVDYLKRNKIGFSQLINEKPRNGIPSWIHFSINGNKGQRGQIFTLV